MAHDCIVRGLVKCHCLVSSPPFTSIYPVAEADSASTAPRYLLTVVTPFLAFPCKCPAAIFTSCVHQAGHSGGFPSRVRLRLAVARHAAPSRQQPARLFSFLFLFFVFIFVFCFYFICVCYVFAIFFSCPLFYFEPVLLIPFQQVRAACHI